MCSKRFIANNKEKPRVYLLAVRCIIFGHEKGLIPMNTNQLLKLKEIFQNLCDSLKHI